MADKIDLLTFHHVVIFNQELRLWSAVLEITRTYVRWRPHIWNAFCCPHTYALPAGAPFVGVFFHVEMRRVRVDKSVLVYLFLHIVCRTEAAVFRNHVDLLLAIRSSLLHNLVLTFWILQILTQIDTWPVYVSSCRASLANLAVGISIKTNWLTNVVINDCASCAHSSSRSSHQLVISVKLGIRLGLGVRLTTAVGVEGGSSHLLHLFSLLENPSSQLLGHTFQFSFIVLDFVV